MQDSREESLTRLTNSLRNLILFPFVLVLLATGLLHYFSNYLEKVHFGLFYLLIVIAAARIGDTRSALAAAVMGFLSWNFFFLPPHYTFAINDPRDWFILFTFLIIGAVVGKITGQMRDREREAIAKEKEIEILYRESLAINMYVNLEDAKHAVLSRIMKHVGASGCAILKVSSGEKLEEDLAIDVSTGETPELSDKDLRKISLWAVRNAKCVGLCKPRWEADRENPIWPISVDFNELIPDVRKRRDMFIPLSSTDTKLGLLYITLKDSERTIDHTSCRFLIAFSGILAILLERQRMTDEMARSAALQESERLKSVLLSSISHNLKNPLVSLKATVSSLLQEDVEWKQETIREHLTYAYEDVERLSRNIESLLSISRLESGAWKPRKDWSDLREIINREISQFPEKDIARFQQEAPENFPLICIDPIQISQVVKHVLENALRYSPPEAPITIMAAFDENEVKFQVDDCGSGIPQEDRDKIFSLFYGRSKSADGTGLGLAICKEIVEAHHGRIWVESSPEGGARFSVILPLKAEVDEQSA